MENKYEYVDCLSCECSCRLLVFYSIKNHQNTLAATTPLRCDEERYHDDGYNQGFYLSDLCGYSVTADGIQIGGL